MKSASLTAVVLLSMALKMTSSKTCGSQDSCAAVTYATLIEHWQRCLNSAATSSEMTSIILRVSLSCSITEMNYLSKIILE